MNALLVDDETSNIENLSTLLRQYCPRVQTISSATDVNTAASLVQANRPDILFLDIQLGERTAFDLLRLLPEKDFEVIFVTAFDRYGIEAIKFAALDYILKPVSIAELVQAVNKAEDKLAAKAQSEQLNFLLNHLQLRELPPAKIALPLLHEIRYIGVENIIRCEADNSYTFFHLADGERILVSRAIKEYSDMLGNSGFLRTHQSHLVNRMFVKSWLKEDGGVLLLSNGTKVPVSRLNKETVQRALKS